MAFSDLLTVPVNTSRTLARDAGVANNVAIAADAGAGAPAQPRISSFLTVESLANFTAVSGAITVAWGLLKTIDAAWSTPLVPLVLALAWGAVSVGISYRALIGAGKGQADVAAAVFVAVLNSLMLAGAVVGAAGAAAAAGTSPDKPARTSASVPSGASSATS